MIQWMQKHKRYLIVTIWISTIAFVGAGFVGWGAYSFALGSGWVAKVGKNTISKEELDREYARLFAIYNQLTGGKLGEKEAQNLGLRSQALNNLIYTQLMLNYAHDLGLLVSDEKVAEEITKETQFYELGLFSPKVYKQILAQNNLRPKDYEEAIRKSLLLRSLDSLMQLAPTQLEKESVAAALYMQDRIAVELLEPKNQAFDVSKEDMLEYWEQNQQSYKGPVQYSFLVDIFKPESVDASESELKEYYEKFITNYSPKHSSFADSKADVLHDYQKAEAEKQALRRYLEYKKTDESETKEALTLSQAQIVDKFGRDVFDALAKTKPLDAIKPIFLDKEGFVTLKLLNVYDAQPLSFDDAKDKVAADILQQKRDESLRLSAANNLKNFNGTDIGFIARDDVGKLPMLTPEEGAEFLSQLFAKTKAKDFIILNQKAVLYNIKEQKLFEIQDLSADKDFLEENVVQLKDKLMESAFVDYLQKRYTVVRADNQ